MGGGVIEACSDFMMPIVENIVGSDPLPGARDAGHVLLSALGDDAVVLGAVALARSHVGRSPFKKQFVVKPKYPLVAQASQGEVTVNQKTYPRDIYLMADGQVKKRQIEKALSSTATRTPSARKNWKRSARVGRKSSSSHGPLRPVDARRRRPALLDPALDRLREAAHGRGRGGLQQVEGPQGGPAPRHVVAALIGSGAAAR